MQNIKTLFEKWTLFCYFFKFNNLPRGMVEVGYFSLLAANVQNTTQKL